MKPSLKIIIGLFAVAALCTAAVQKITRGFQITETDDVVHLKIIESGTQSANALEVWRGGTRELAIPGTNTAAGLKQNLGFQSGSFHMQGTSSNVSFATNFSSPPTVVQSVSRVLPTNQIISAVTVSNFTVTAAGTTGTSNTTSWIAIGPP